MGGTVHIDPLLLCLGEFDFGAYVSVFAGLARKNGLRARL